MIKTRINNEYKDVVKIFGGGTLQKEIIKVWSREAQEYVYESSIEYTGSLPITISANGDVLIDYRIYGADEGEYVSYSDGKIYRMVDGTLIPTDPPVPLPEIPTINGKTVIDYDGDQKPSQMYVKYRR